MPFTIDIELKRGRARLRERNASARIVRGPGEVNGYARDGRAFGERWLEFGKNEAEAGDVVVHQEVDRTWRALLVTEGGFLVEIRPDPEDGSQWYDRHSFAVFRREVSRLAGLDAGGRRAEVERQIGIADTRLRRMCRERGGDYGVCRRADPDGPPPAPEMSAGGGADWNAVRGRVRALRTARAALLAVDAGIGGSAPAARLAALEAKGAALEAELRSVRDEAAALSGFAPPDLVILKVPVHRAVPAALDDRAAELGVTTEVLIRGAVEALAGTPLEAPVDGRKDREGSR